MKFFFVYMSTNVLQPQNLESSGVEVVLNGAILAIVGAITLQHGSVVASKVVRERILARLPKNE